MKEDLRKQFLKIGLKEQFIKVYSNVPLNMRDEIILLIGDKKKPISWDVAYFEVRENTEKSKEILEGLKELDLI